MLILITVLLLSLSALSLFLLRIFQPNFRYSWSVAVIGAFLAWTSVLVWRIDMPLVLSLPAWQPTVLFPEAPFFLVDRISWAYAFALVTLVLATLLTALVRPHLNNMSAWAGMLGIGSVGLLALLAENPLTLVLAWTAIDLAELFTLLGSVRGKRLRERVVISFTMRLIGSAFLLWANFVSVAVGSRLNFVGAPSQAGIYMLIAAGLRLGVLPMHLPFRTESALRRGFGTVLRLTSAASSLILLARIPFASLYSPLIPYLLGLVAVTALYSSWMWLRATDILAARPYWILGMASLALTATLRANPSGSVAWGLALIFGGGALFLSSVEHLWLKRSLWLNMLLMAGLPFTLTATGWQHEGRTWWIFMPFFLAAHALLLAGYFRHAQHKQETPLVASNDFLRALYPSGILIFSLAQLALGIFGWEGARQLGAWYLSPATIGGTALLIWLRPRIRALNPLEAHWLTPNTEAGFSRVYNLFWNTYYSLRNLLLQITKILESDGGILWALLFLIVFASILSGGIR